jgi:hypothetical protein
MFHMFHFPPCSMFHFPLRSMFHFSPCSMCRFPPCSINFHVPFSKFYIPMFQVPAGHRTQDSILLAPVSSFPALRSTSHVPSPLSGCFHIPRSNLSRDDMFMTMYPQCLFPRLISCPRVRQARPDSSWTSCLSLIPAHSCRASCCQHDTPPQPSTYRGKLCQVPHL